MSHQDQSPDHKLNSQHLDQALQWLLAGISWKPITLRQDCSWTPVLLVRAALLWAWSDELTLEERFSTSRRLVAHLAPRHGDLAGSSQAFMKLLRRWTASLVCLVVLALRKRVRKALSAQWECSGFAVFGVDGSRVELPRTKSHEAAYSASPKRSGKKKRNRRKQPGSSAATKKANVPQMWLTTLIHVGTGLPWDWRTGPSDSSEREHALDMLQSIPEKGLLTGDAGFVGYDFARAVLDSGRHLLIRVGANVKLLRKLAYVRESEGTVYVWPEKAAKNLQSPLVFRLVIAQGPKHPIYMITSVRDPKTLSDRDVRELYRRRWGIELFYRHLKHTFQKRRLKSLTSENAAVELEWSLVGLWGLGLSAAVEIAKSKVPLSRISMAGVLKAFRRLMRDYLHSAVRGQTLCVLLQRALVDTYVRKNKSSRDYPRKKKHERTGSPTIANATAQQIKQAQMLKFLKKG
jgi:hypothetical protein